MKPSAFNYHRPNSLDGVLQLLAEHGDAAKVIAGGQSLAPMLNMRLASPVDLIDLNDLTELAYIREAGDCIEIGALTRHHQIAESALVSSGCPLLAQAARTIGHYAIRQRGTLGGSMAHADPAAQFALTAVTLDAEIDIVSSRGRRTLRASEFFLSVMETALAADEVIQAVRFPKVRANEGVAFRLFNRRHGDFAIVATAVTVALERDRVAQLRIGMCGTGAVPLSQRELVRKFTGRVADTAWVDEVSRAVRDASEPEDDSRIPAVFRKELTEMLVGCALRRALERAKG